MSAAFWMAGGAMLLSAFAVVIALYALLSLLWEPEYTATTDDPVRDPNAPEYHTQEPLQ